MASVLITLLFAAAFAASAWTLYASVKPQLHRYRALFGAVPATSLAPLPMVPNRVTVRWSNAPRPRAGSPLRAAA